MEQEIRQLAEHALKTERAFNVIEFRLNNARLLLGVQGDIAIETDNLLEEWKTLGEACNMYLAHRRYRLDSRRFTTRLFRTSFGCTASLRERRIPLFKVVALFAASVCSLFLIT